MNGLAILLGPGAMHELDRGGGIPDPQAGLQKSPNAERFHGC